MNAVAPSVGAQDDSSKSLLKPFHEEETVGERLQRLRVSRDLSQRELGARSGVSFSYISRLEAGSRSPSVRAIRALAQALRITPEYLEHGVDLTVSERLELRLASLVVEDRLTGKDTATELGALAEAAQAVPDLDLAVRAHIAAGEAALRSGDHESAARWFQAATASDAAAPAVHPEAHIGYARACQAAGRRDDAVEVVERALRLLDEPGPDDAAARTRLLASLAECLSEAGDPADVQATLERAVAASSQARPLDRARALWEAAREAVARRELRPALRHMRTALVLVSEADARLELGQAELSCGEALVWAGDLQGAGAILTAAKALVTNVEAALEARSRALEAAVVAADEPERARALLDGTERVLGETDPARGIARYARALVEAASTDAGAADAAFRSAVEILESTGRSREASIVCREWAHALRAAGKTDRAAEALDRATDLSARANAERIRRSVQPLHGSRQHG